MSALIGLMFILVMAGMIAGAMIFQFQLATATKFMNASFQTTNATYTATNYSIATNEFSYTIAPVLPTVVGYAVLAMGVIVVIAAGWLVFNSAGCGSRRR